jgi:hypothetical protein
MPGVLQAQSPCQAQAPSYAQWLSAKVLGHCLAVLRAALLGYSKIYSLLLFYTLLHAHGLTRVRKLYRSEQLFSFYRAEGAERTSLKDSGERAFDSDSAVPN